MAEEKHTQGPWQTNGSHVYGPEPTRELVAQLAETGNGRLVANRDLIAAAPELLAVNQNWEIRGPDADGLLWLILHGKGTTGRAMFNLGRATGMAGQVAALLEQDRIASTAKAKGHP